MRIRAISDALRRAVDRLGYVLVPKWRLSDPGAQKLFDELGYVLLPKARLNSMHVQLFDDAVNYYLVPKARAWRLPGAVHLNRLFGLLKIDCVLDVGANRGQYRDYLREEVGFRGPVVSFEPIPSHVGLLQDRTQSDSQWIVRGCALGASSGTAAFNVMKASQFSSFLDPDHSIVKSFEAENRVAERLTVPIDTLDNVFPEIERRFGCRNAYLKLDTQGYDLEVLKGAEKTLAKVRALQIEASIKPIYKGMPDFATALRALADLGFELSGIFQNNEGHFPRLLEFDAVLIRRAF